MEDTGSLRVSAPYEAELERTMQALLERKRELEYALHQLRASAASSGNPMRDPVQIMADAYRSVTEAEPVLPPPGPILPALLAMRRAHQTIHETNESIQERSASLEKIQQRIEAERARLREQEALHAALKRRIQSLRQGLEDRLEKSEDQRAKERIAELKKQKQHWDVQTRSLMKELDWFIQEHLGPMLAAEELGGPVVGGLMDIDADDVGAGFTAQGKLRTAKAQPDEDKRQRRLDEIWGWQDQQEQAGRRQPRNEASAASAEMRDLVEQLMNRLMEAEGDTSAAYVEIPRESAAVRFLVRSKVAEFHPRDARRLRLVDFGRDLED
ncbi:hypothetical protein VTJ83DRAFT_2266 [Remersonia thermophila]|uniref:Uncharacterized protein n=1 Tax=Remersonia thermophila TaxID=72144 RepID=A0ABR4DI93_9PEZI